MKSANSIDTKSSSFLQSSKKADGSHQDRLDGSGHLLTASQQAAEVERDIAHPRRLFVDHGLKNPGERKHLELRTPAWLVAATPNTP
jgi:hypothetical protein